MSSITAVLAAAVAVPQSLERHLAVLAGEVVEDHNVARLQRWGELVSI